LQNANGMGLVGQLEIDFMEADINTKPEIIQHLLNEDDHYPNNPSLPLLIYKNVFRLPKKSPAAYIENIFEKNDWKNTWRDDIFTYHHYHSNSHEVLGAFTGHCIVQFGGDHGITEELRSGDVVIIPAGVAHKKIAGEQFKCVGAYPGGADYNTRFGAAGEAEAAKSEIAQVALPTTDPVFGKDGPMGTYWRRLVDSFS
jgi:uncharacterized protein YjlB